MTAISNKPKLPRYLKWANKIVMFLNKRGFVVGTMSILTTKGRISGKPISNPVSILTFNHEKYICTVGDTNWVLNARKNPSITLQRGHDTEHATLVEIQQDQRAPILRSFPEQIPGGVGFFKQSIGISGSPDSFAAASDRCRVFRIES